MADNLKMDKSIIEKVAKNIKKYRKQKKLTQLKLSLKSGVTASTIGAFETTGTDITLTKLNAIALGLGMSLAELVTVDE